MIRFTVGLAWLAVMAFASAWPDMEASLFDATTVFAADESLEALRCPLALAPGEQATVAATFANPTDSALAFLVRARTSRGFVSLADEDTRRVELGPGESQTVVWPVTAESAVYDRIVMVRVLAMRGGGQPARQKGCGILVLDAAGMSGQAVFLVSIALGLAVASSGAIHWWMRSPLPVKRRRRRALGPGLLAALVLASLVAGVVGAWPASFGLLVAAALFVLGLLEGG